MSNHNYRLRGAATFAVFWLLLLLAAARPALPQPPPIAGGGFVSPADKNLDMDGFTLEDTTGDLNLSTGSSCVVFDSPLARDLYIGSSNAGIGFKTACLDANITGIVSNPSGILILQSATGQRLILAPGSDLFATFEKASTDRILELNAAPSQIADILLIRDSGNSEVLAFDSEANQLTITGDVISGTSSMICQSAAPSGGVLGVMYCDSDLTVPCFHNGTNFVQMDDFSTVCS